MSFTKEEMDRILAITDANLRHQVPPPISPRDVLDLCNAYSALLDERDALAAMLQEARDNIGRRYGPPGTNNIDAPLLARIDAALDGAKGANRG